VKIANFSLNLQLKKSKATVGPPLVLPFPPLASHFPSNIYRLVPNDPGCGVDHPDTTMILNKSRRFCNFIGRKCAKMISFTLTLTCDTSYWGPKSTHRLFFLAHSFAACWHVLAPGMGCHRDQMYRIKQRGRGQWRIQNLTMACQKPCQKEN